MLDDLNGNVGCDSHVVNKLPHLTLLSRRTQKLSVVFLPLKTRKFGCGRSENRLLVHVIYSITIASSEVKPGWKTIIMDAEDLLRGASHLSNSAENYENDATVEELWVRKACRYADVHQKLISTFDPTLLKLTKHDDRIYEAFKSQFSEFNILNVDVESLKSDSNKEKWRSFCDEFKDIESFNFGTLVRLNCREKYTQANTILVTRIQFLALEIARNREGMNNFMWTTESAADGNSANDGTATRVVRTGETADPEVPAIEVSLTADGCVALEEDCTGNSVATVNTVVSGTNDVPKDQAS